MPQDLGSGCSGAKAKHASKPFDVGDLPRTLRAGWARPRRRARCRRAPGACRASTAGGSDLAPSARACTRDGERRPQHGRGGKEGHGHARAERHRSPRRERRFCAQAPRACRRRGQARARAGPRGARGRRRSARGVARAAVLRVDPHGADPAARRAGRARGRRSGNPSTRPPAEARAGAWRAAPATLAAQGPRGAGATSRGGGGGRENRRGGRGAGAAPEVAHDVAEKRRGALRPCGARTRRRGHAPFWRLPRAARPSHRPT